MVRSLSTSRVLYVMASQQEYGPCLQKRIEPLITGVGVVEAATTLAKHLQELACEDQLPEIVVSLGSAASATKKVGSVYQISGVSWRDMDASKLGFPKGLTPCAHHPLVIPLRVPSAALPSAKLSTGSNFVGAQDFGSFPGELADMETLATVRVCERFSVPVIGLRGVSDGQSETAGVASWEARPALIDRDSRPNLSTRSVVPSRT